MSHNRFRSAHHGSRVGFDGDEPGLRSDEVALLDCGACPHDAARDQAGDAAGCDGCVVSFLLGREADDAVVIDVADVAEERALRLLADEGMLGHVVERRAVPRAGAGPGARARPAV